MHHGRGGRVEPADPDQGDEEREAGGGLGIIDQEIIPLRFHFHSIFVCCEQVKHNTIFASLGKTEDENGEAIGSHAYYLVKLAQEKAELKDTTAVLKKKIKKEESDLRSLQKALTMIKSSNTDFRTGNLRKKAAEDAEMVSLKEEATEKREELRLLQRFFNNPKSPQNIMMIDD